MKRTSDIPRTGRIGRFAKIVEARTKQDTLLRIMKGAEQYGEYRPEQKARWWKQTVERLESELGDEAAVEIMGTCGGKCCGSGQRKTAKRLMIESSSIPDFLDKVSHYKVKEGEIEYRMIYDHRIIGKHNRCFCGQVRQSKELFAGSTYCQCSVAFNRQFFGAAFDKPVQMELKSSILNGDDFCEFDIRIAEKE